MTMLYLAHPLDLATEGGAHALSEVYRYLSEENVGYYDPGQAWCFGSPSHADCAVIHQANLQVVRQCSGLLAVMDGLTVGVPIEIAEASAAGIPTAVYKVPNALNSVVLRALGVQVLFDDAELIDWLRELRRK